MFSCPAHYLVWFDIGLPSLVHGCITIRRCDASFIIQIRPELWRQGQISRVLTYLCVRPITIFWFDIGLPYLAHWSITMRRCDKYIHVPDSMLTCDLKAYVIFSCTTCNFCNFLIRGWPFTSRSNLWGSWHGFKFKPQVFFCSFDVVILCLASECITMVRCVAYIHALCMTLTFDLNIKIIFESCKLSLLFDIGLPNFGIWVYHHETTCWVYSWPKYDLDPWPIWGWRGYP